jgi:hypothetical protein
MSLQHHLPDQVVRADPWTLFCAECSRKMRITTATPAQDGRETRTYECACGQPVNDIAHFPRAPGQPLQATPCDRRLSVGRGSRGVTEIPP